MAGEKRGTKKERKKEGRKEGKKERKKSRAPSGVVAGCPRASFRDAPHEGGELWGHDGGAVPGPCNLKSSQGGSRGLGGEEITLAPLTAAAPPHLILRRQCSKLTRNSPCNQPPRSQTFSGKRARFYRPTMEPAIASLLRRGNDLRRLLALRSTLHQGRGRGRGGKPLEASSPV